MGLLNGLLKAGIAKKVAQEASKPQNQAKARQLLSQLSRRRGAPRP
jgi:hypothetical protein